MLKRFFFLLVAFCSLSSGSLRAEVCYSDEDAAALDQYLLIAEQALLRQETQLATLQDTLRTAQKYSTTLLRELIAAQSWQTVLGNQVVRLSKQSDERETFLRKREARRLLTTLVSAIAAGLVIGLLLN